MNTPETANGAAARSTDRLAAPVQIEKTAAYRGVTTIANIYGTEIALVAGSVEALAMAWARLMPDTPFNPNVTQEVVLLSAKLPIFNAANAESSDAMGGRE